MDGDGAISKQELWTFLHKQVRHLTCMAGGNKTASCVAMYFDWLTRLVGGRAKQGGICCIF